MVWTHNLNPALISMGSFQIRWYGLMYIVGFVAAYYLFRKFSREGFFRLNYEQIDSLLFYGFIGLFVGARIFYIIFYNLDHYLNNPLDMLAIWKGGLSFHGGLVGIITAAFILSRKYKVSFWNFGDNIVTCAPIGIMCGRLGNFINGELYGRPTNGNWGIIFPDGGSFPRHPSQLYEAFSEGLLIFTILFFIRGRLPAGRQSALFLLLYGTFRFLVEFFRQPDAQLGFIWMQLSMGQLLCVAMIAIGIVMWFLRKPTQQT